MLSFVIGGSWFVTSGKCSSLPAELRCALFQKGGRALVFVFGCGAEGEISGLKKQAFALAGFQPLVHRFKRKLDGDWRVGCKLVQDCLGAGDQLGRRNDFIDEADAPRLLCADHLTGKNELQRAPLADQPRQTLRSTAARHNAEPDFRLAELRVLGGDSD